MNWKRTARWSWFALPFLLLALWPGVAAAGETAVLYELTENMKLKNLKGGGVSRRIATSAITGFADSGSPPCPADLILPGTTHCAINATVSSNVNTTTGLGTIAGEATVVQQGDNPFDGPEFVVMKVKIRGDIDFSPAFLTGVPFGTVKGFVIADHGHKKRHKKSDFTGVFRQPFLGSVAPPELGGATTLRQAFCPFSPDPNANFGLGGPDLAYVDTAMLPDGTVVPNGYCINILPGELSINAPTVRLDISF